MASPSRLFSVNSPVTPPTSVMGRIFSKAQRASGSTSERKDVLWRLVHPDGDGNGSLINLNDAQMGYCGEALKQLTKKLSVSGGRRKIDREFDSLLVLQSEKVQVNQFLARTSVARLEINQSKNRYLDVLPYDDTRVILNAQNNWLDKASSYINASYIVDPAHEDLPSFIATQGPLKNTVADFWEMVMQQQCPVIVMLTCEADQYNQISKCDSYFPAEPQTSQVYGQIKVTNKSVKVSKTAIVVRLLEIEFTQSGDVPLQVLHLQYVDWPDHGVPAITFSVRELFRILYRIPKTFGPFVVHCSAGIGRTGTLCTIDHTLRRILSGDLFAVDIENTVQQFRQQRFGMVQTRDQYGFCYQTVIEELQDIALRKGL